MYSGMHKYLIGSKFHLNIWKMSEFVGFFFVIYVTLLVVEEQDN